MVQQKSPRKVQRDEVVAAKIADEPAPMPKLRSDAETASTLTAILHDAPDTPVLMNMTEVTEWLDKKYRPWLRKARFEVPK